MKRFSNKFIPLEARYVRLCVLVLILCIAPASAAQSRRFEGRKEAKPYTRNLPAADKVELLRLKLDGDLWHGEIESSKIVKGSAARRIAALWRSQTYLSGMTACHLPAYAIKFYAGDKLLVYASLCWACNNIGFITPGLEYTQYFEGRNKKGQQLLQIFREAFPDTKQTIFSKTFLTFRLPSGL